MESSSPLTSATRSAALTSLLVSLRPKQWVKNLCVLAPLIFAQRLTDWTRIRPGLIAGLCFCLAASGLYLINDLLDCNEDRQHPVKRNRPIASGRLSRGIAVLSAATILGASMMFSLFLDLRLTLLVGFYIVIALSYSIWLKHVVLLDVMTIAFGLVLRVVAGAAAERVEASHWILLCTFLLALFLGFTKRRQELTALLENSNQHRPVLAHYGPALIDQMNTVVLGATIVTYALYTVSGETIAKFHTDRLIYTLPFVVYGLFRYLYLVHQCDDGGNPTDQLFRDRPLVFCVALWAIACTAIINIDSLH